MKVREMWACVIFSFLVAIACGLVFKLVDSGASDTSVLIVQYGTLIYSYIVATEIIPRRNFKELGTEVRK